MAGSNLILINTTDLGSDVDGNGSGSDPTADAGCIVEVDEGSEMVVTAFYGQSATAGEPGDADTLDYGIEGSVDGGTTWFDIVDFRQVVGAEVPDDESAGDKTLRLAIPFRVPQTDDDQTNGRVKIRPVTAASDTSHWGLYSDIRAKTDVREEWLQNALVKHNA